MKSLPFIFLLVIVFGFFACTEKCDDPDVQAINSLYFELKQGGDDGFTAEELDSVYYVRFVPFSDPLIADTFFTNGFFPDGEGKFYINDSFPFRNDQAPYYPIYGYQVIEPTSGFIAVISDIELGGTYTGDCDYQNNLKTFSLDGDSINTPGSFTHYLITR